MHPVVRAAFKAVELLIKWLEGSTPSSSADINLNQVELFYCEDNLPYLSPVIVNYRTILSGTKHKTALG